MFNIYFQIFRSLEKCGGTVWGNGRAILNRKTAKSQPNVAENGGHWWGTFKCTCLGKSPGRAPVAARAVSAKRSAALSASSESRGPSGTQWWPAQSAPSEARRCVRGRGAVRAVDPAGPSSGPRSQRQAKHGAECEGVVQ